MSNYCRALVIQYTCVTLVVTYVLAMYMLIQNVHVLYRDEHLWRELNQIPKGNPGIALLREEWSQPFFVDVISVDAAQ